MEAELTAFFRFNDTPLCAPPRMVIFSLFRIEVGFFGKFRKIKELEKTSPLSSLRTGWVRSKLSPPMTFLFDVGQ